MGPRKAIVSRGKRTAEPVSTERRTKMRSDPAQQQSRPGSPPQAVSTMGNRSVTSGRKVDLEFLDRENFRIGDWIRRQHWERFCTLSLPYYPSLVRNFFENLRIGHGSVESTVKGVLIVLNEAKLSNMLAIPRTGKCFMTLNNKEEALKTVLEKEKVTDLRSLQAGQLSLEMKLLHSMVSRIFFPKTGRFDWVNEREIVFMHYLIKGEQINLPFLMLTQIKEAAKGKRACLPYGMIFTLIFNEYGVNLDGEISKKLLHTDTYNERSLTRMGYLKKDDRWVKKAVSQKESDSDDDDDDDEDDEDNEDEEEDNVEHTAPAETTIPDIATADDQATTSVPAMETTRSSPTATTTQHTFSSGQIAQFSELLKTELSSLVGEVKEEITQTRQQVTHSYEELRGDIRDLTLRVEVLEQKQRSQDLLHSEIIDLRSEFGSLRGAADRFAQDQDQILSSVQQGMKKVEVGIDSLMICLLGSSNPTGGSSTSSRPPPQPQPQPRPPPHYTPRNTPRAPFSATVHPGTGFPEPSSTTRVGSRTHRSRGRASCRSSKIHAPYSVSIDDSNSENSD